MEENIYMERSGTEDQQSSATGYTYQVQSGNPLHFQNVGTLQNFGYPPITLGRYTQNLPPALPINNHNYLAPQHLVLAPLNSYGTPVQPAAYALPAAQAIPAAAPVAAPILNKYIGGGGGGEESDSSNFKKGGGQSYNNQHSNAAGEKGTSGYENKEQYEKGNKGQHDQQQQQGYYNQEGGNKAAAHDEGGHYSKAQAASQGSKGESFSEKSGRKKGSKTTGYHRVHHKDEYKKDHSFYDESDSSGNFNKYGDYDAKHSDAEGKYAKGGNLDSGYKAQDYGKKGEEDKGHYAKEDAGFKGAQGKQAHYKEIADYAKKGEQDEGKQFGYSEAQGAKLYH